jgi:predicted Zn-dependent protease
MSALTISSTDSLRKPIYITLDERLSRKDKSIVINNLESLFNWYEKLARVRIRRYYFDGPWCKDPDQPFCRPNFYIRICRAPNGKIDASCMLDISKREPWQQKEPHYEVYVVDDIIFDGNPNINFLFGLTFSAIFPGNYISRGIAGTVLSTRILKELYGPNWPTAFLVIAAHELGHLFGLPDPNSPYYISYNHPWANESFLYVGHCSYEYCAMRQVNSGGSHHKDLLDHARDVLNNNPNLYCDYDRQQLVRNLRTLFG